MTVALAASSRMTGVFMMNIQFVIKFDSIHLVVVVKAM
jgi:hypothetical protein